MNDMIRRRDIAQAAMRRYQHAPFAYGKNDCVRLGAFVLRRRGHRLKLAKAGTYHSALGAVRAMKRAGVASIEEALDAMQLPRIAPAAALPCDLVLIPGEGPFGGALTMAVGNGRVLGYHQDLDGADVLQPTEYVGAWRV